MITMDWGQLVEEITAFAETISDKNTAVDVDADGSCVEVWLTVGSEQYKIFLTAED